MSRTTQVRVLHILNELKPSGAELMLHVAARLWSGSGIRGEILCTGKVAGSFAATLEKDGFRIHHVPFSKTPSYVLRVIRLMESRAFDVVHIHTERGSLWYGIAARLVRVRKVIRTIHSVFAFEGRLRVRKYIGRAILRILGVKSISVGESVRSTELDCFSNPTETVANWFDDSHFVPPADAQRQAARRDLSLRDNDFVIISVAGVCRDLKNHQAILRAMTLFEETSVYLHIGDERGSGEKEYTERLGIQERVRFLGAVPDPLPYFHAADVFVMPSTHEGFGCAAIEAMAAGLPVVLSRVPGLVDFATRCPEIVWSDCSAESVASAIEWLREMGEDARRQIGRKLSRVVHEKFGTSNGATRYAEFYLEAMTTER